MYAECELSYRLTYKEIVYLAASIGADEIYGLRHEQDAEHTDTTSLPNEWKHIRTGLHEKKILKQKNDESVLDSNVYEIIQTLSHPKLFFAARSKDDLIDINRNYYFANHLSVKLEYDTVNKDVYTLTRYDNPNTLKESLINFFTFYDRPFQHSDQSICLGIDELKEFLQSVTDNNRERQMDILYRQGLDQAYVIDIAEALEMKSCLRTMLVIAFSETTQSVVKEYIMYGGGKYLWQIEFRNAKAYITSIDNESIDYKMAVLSDVLFYL